MNTRAYTDADLVDAATGLRQAIARNTDFADFGDLMADRTVPSTVAAGAPATWNELLDDDEEDDWADLTAYEEAREEVFELARKASDTSAWAVRLGAAGLQPHEPFAVRSTTCGYEVAVQVATHPDLTEDARTELVAAIHAAVEETTTRVLGMTPADRADT
ncbi:hypothetical protein CUT44_14110 [Streptomyces carminius]|uniref:Uncharacterized protein n=1 Tax=Streptomyces carminius TaxID=2665496 RepID=A0A2M8LYT9_9ACTN|nr:hypothetical protein [Streptomyces carminius]PJE97112.1 hypothetical protein CUT44_14110 [Streptomyces carminius]